MTLFAISKSRSFFPSWFLQTLKGNHFDPKMFSLDHSLCYPHVAGSPKSDWVSLSFFAMTTAISNFKFSYTYLVDFFHQVLNRNLMLAELLRILQMREYQTHGIIKLLTGGTSREVQLEPGLLTNQNHISLDLPGSFLPMMSDNRVL